MGSARIYLPNNPLKVTCLTFIRVTSMAKVTRKKIPTTKPYKVRLQKSAHTSVSTLEKLLSEDKSLDWDMHAELSNAIEKIANSALKDIENLNAVKPPAIPESIESQNVN